MKRSALAVLSVLSIVVAVGTAYGRSFWKDPEPMNQGFQKTLLTADGGAVTVPTLATDGIDLVRLKAYNITVEVDVQINTAGDIGYWNSGVDTGTVGAANTIGLGCSLLAYLYDPIRQAWSASPANDIDLSAASKKLVGLTRGTVSAVTPPASIGRIAYIPHANCAVPLKVYLTSAR